MARNVFEVIRTVSRKGLIAEFTPHTQPEPCASMPGTPAKLAALAARADAGEELWGEGDRLEMT